MLNCARRLRCLQLAAVARRARFAIGSDTGPLHLAAAAGTPCIGLYGPWPADKHGPYGPQHINLQKMCMEGTTQQRRRAPSIYMEAIDVGLVFEACDRMISRAHAPRGNALDGRSAATPQTVTWTQSVHPVRDDAERRHEE